MLCYGCNSKWTGFIKDKTMFYLVFKIALLVVSVNGVGRKDLAWSGGPVHLECEHAAELFTRNGQYIRDNVIATKALVHKDTVYVLTPR